MIKTASEIREMEAKAEVLRNEAFKIKDEAKKVGDDQTPDMKSKALEEFRSKYEEFEAITKDINDARADLDKSIQIENWKAAGNDVNQNTELEGKTVADHWLNETKDIAASQLRAHGNVHLKDVDPADWLGAKATFSTSAGIDPFVVRQPGVTNSPQPEVMVMDTLPMFTTNQHSVKFLRETTLTNNSSTKAEAAALAESALETNEITTEIEKLGTFLPVTEEQLDDEPQARAYINGRLAYMVRYNLDNQIVNGDGTSPNLEGMLDTGLLTQAKGSDTISNAILKARTKVKKANSGSGGGARPNILYMSPDTFESIALERTADGEYIYGGPTMLRQNMTIWGLPIVETETLSTTAIVADRNYLALAMRRGVTIAVSDSHGTNFINNILVIRAHVRAGLVRYRPTAICSVTGV